MLPVLPFLFASHAAFRVGADHSLGTSAEASMTESSGSIAPGKSTAWSGLWNASVKFNTGLPLVVLGGLEISTQLPVSPSGVAPVPAVTVARLWSGVVTPDSLDAPSSGRISTRLWHVNVYLGVEYDTSFEGTTAIASQNMTALSLSRSVRLATQQGWVVASEQHTFRLLDSDRLRYTMQCDRPNSTAVFEFVRAAQAKPKEKEPAQPHPASTSLTLPRVVSKKWRSSIALPNTESLHQPHQASNHLVPALVHQPLARNSSASVLGAESRESKTVNAVYNIALNDSWSISNGGVDSNLLLLSLQGLANRHQRSLYLTYPNTWAYSYTSSVREWVTETYDLPFTELRSADEALHALRRHSKGYIVFDPAVRESIMVGLTAAGIMDAVLVSPNLLPMVKATGLPCALDLRNRFLGWPAVRIYTWAREQFFDKCSKHVIVWLGGACDDVIHPAVADWGVSQRAFFTDLDTRPDVPAASEEYNLADSLVASLDLSLPTPPLVMGWHSYCKDFEHTFASLASKHGGRVHGLNTNPNLSFMNKLPLPANFSFHNNRPDMVGSIRSVNAKSMASTFVMLVQTDGLGLGAWNKPGRGTLPYSWEVTLPDLEIQPALLAMFYSQATANDTFVAALSGPGYVYPKAAGAHLPRMLALARESMATLDLDVMIVFDASNSSGSSSALGDTTLPAEVVAEYSRCLPNATGFLNGYGPSFTASPNEGHVFLSFDYYLDEQRPTNAVAEDLANLAKLNTNSPYFLAVHVREYSNVNKVAGILRGLEGTKVVSVHDFVALANKHATYRTRFGPAGPGQTS